MRIDAIRGIGYQAYEVHGLWFKKQPAVRAAIGMLPGGGSCYATSYVRGSSASPGGHGL
jgi:hypothetical protein